MFCPYCGDTLILMQRGWYCQRGDVELAPRTGDHLLSLVETVSTDAAQIPAEFKVSWWHCPRCQTHMRMNQRGIEGYCPECGLHFRPYMIHELVELHYHKPTSE